MMSACSKCFKQNRTLLYSRGLRRKSWICRKSIPRYSSRVKGLRSRPRSSAVSFLVDAASGPRQVVPVGRSLLHRPKRLELLGRLKVPGWLNKPSIPSRTQREVWTCLLMHPWITALLSFLGHTFGHQISLRAIRPFRTPDLTSADYKNNQWIK